MNMTHCKQYLTERERKRKKLYRVKNHVLFITGQESTSEKIKGCPINRKNI